MSASRLTVEMEIRKAAIWSAASRIVPAEWQDLSSLVIALDGDAEALLLPADHLNADANAYDRSLLGYLQATISESCVDAMAVEISSALVQGARFIDISMPEYPELLRKAYNAPPWLFCAGARLKQHGIAIVGSRTVSSDVLDATRTVTAELRDFGIPIISGAAIGVDMAAHQEALDSHAGTVAVLGSGLDHGFRHRPDAEQLRHIASTGSVISAFPLAAPPTRSSLPLRNAVISGLAVGSVVMSARERSGTRTEVEHSLRQGRPVCFWAGSSSSLAWTQELHPRTLVSYARSTEEVAQIVRGWLERP